MNKQQTDKVAKAFYKLANQIGEYDSAYFENAEYFNDDTDLDPNLTHSEIVNLKANDFCNDQGFTKGDQYYEDLFNGYVKGVYHM